MLEAGSLEGTLAEWEAFKICFVCIFVHKSSKISPQERVLQQHSCLECPWEAKTKGAWTQWKQVGWKAQKDIYCREKKPLGAYTVPELLRVVQSFLLKQGATDPCPEDVTCSLY